MNISLSKFKSFTVEGGKRILKVFQFGAKTAKECYPFGFDSVPLENYTAIFAETTNRDEAVIIGYINKNQLAELGESRVYSVGTNGEVKAFMWAKANGDIWLNGSQYTAVRYSNLNDALQNQKTLINAELIKIQTAIVALGGTYSMTDISIDVSSSESATVKMK